ncbi:MAG: hypothetical protein HN849_12225 [Victivallales bacterium]|jgi:hypothetical protein|nr:hypothetical protein [Victivallales bacterium]MBT7165764.1 hypothetical protein [Victivallales bacterium]MBT7300277.1 hypothetical protein [Victivallales bacterium]
MPTETCKGCRATVRVAPESIQKLLAEYLATYPQPTADEPTVASRLALCRACPDLRYGTTCMHCGCLVDIRARLAAARCPHPRKPRW